MTSTTTRTSDTRAKKTKEVVYRPPEERKLGSELQGFFTSQGYRLRWIRHQVEGKDDVKSWLKRENEGYVPVKPEELPSEYQAIFDIGTSGKSEGLIMNHDTILCKIPLQNFEARKKFYEQRAVNQEQAVNDQLLQGNKKMPGFNNSHSSTTRGRPPAKFGSSESD